MYDWKYSSLLKLDCILHEVISRSVKRATVQILLNMHQSEMNITVFNRQSDSYYEHPPDKIKLSIAGKDKISFNKTTILSKRSTC